MVLNDDFYNECPHSSLEMIRGVVDAALLKQRFRPRSITLDWVVSARVASVEHKLVTVAKSLFNLLCTMDSYIVDQHNAFATPRVLCTF